MSADRPDDRATRFGRGELPEDGVRPDEMDQAVSLGRELEDLALRTAVRPSAEFTDRVMAAIEAEPVPAPVIAAGSALRAGALGGVLVAIRDSFRVAFGGGFPMAARAQALALVMVVVLAAGGTGIVAARAVGLLDDRGTPPPSPSPSLPEPSTSPVPSPSESMPPPSPTPSTSTGPTDSPEPSATPEASETPHPTGTDDHGGGPGGGSGPGGWIRRRLRVGRLRVGRLRLRIVRLGLREQRLRRW